VFFVIGTINLVLLTVLAMLVVQIRGFVRKAEPYSSSSEHTILHPLLDFDQIRSIPRVPDIELIFLALIILLISNFLALVQTEGKSIAETWPQWWVIFEVIGILTFCHALLRYSKHMVEKERDDWHRAYDQTHDFLLFRTLSFLVLTGCLVWMTLYLPSWSFLTDPQNLSLYQQPILLLRIWVLLSVIYFMNWILRLRGEIGTLMKILGGALVLCGMVGCWLAAFAFDANPQQWMLSSTYHLGFLICYLSLVLLLFRDNMVLLSATHRAAQIIAEEKRVMLDFLVKMADDPNLRFEDLSSNKRIRQDLNYILRVTLTFAMKQSNAKAGAVYLLDSALETTSYPENGRYLIPQVVEGPYPPLQQLPIDYLATRIKYLNELFLTERIDLEEYPFFRKIIAGAKLLFLPDARLDHELPQQPTDFLRINTLVAVPLAMNKRVLGLLVVVNKFAESDKGWAPFTPQDASLLNAVADQAAIAISNARMHEVIDEQERLEREIEIARKVQESLLPSTFPKLPGYQLYAFSKAARQIGGDYYDFVWMDKERLALVIADVAGKGIPGALTMAALRSALRALASKGGNARDLTIDLNRFIFDDLKKDVFISLTLAILDLSKGTLSIVRAGHEPTLLFRHHETEPHLLISTGMALGLDCGSLFEDSLEESSINLLPEDLVVFYTDGLTEAMDDQGVEFSLDRLIDVLKRSRGNDLEYLVNTVQTEIDLFNGDQPPHDDVTMVILRAIGDTPSGE
jgi:serine phosphatase RsbU (regulator of sigma subunit)